MNKFRGRTTALSSGHSILAAVLLAGALAGSSRAQDGAPDGALAKAHAEISRRFAGADLDHDGRLTREEARGRMPRVYDRFDEIDAAHKGYVTLEEIEAYALAQWRAKQPDPPTKPVP
jgi:hypothetical protein